MRIVVANADRVVAKVMRVVLSGAGHDTVLAQSATDALHAVAAFPTDAVLLDVDLTSGDGYEICRALRENHYAGPVLFVSRRRDTKDKLRAFEYGADDYLVAPFDPAELLARIDVIARRCQPHAAQNSQTSLKVGDAELMLSDLTFHVPGQPEVLLTPTEMRLLECLMRNVDRTVSREALIERTWGYDFLGDSNRVEVYVARLRKKIEPNPGEPQYLHTIRGLGYMFRSVAPRIEASPRIRTARGAPGGHPPHAIRHLVPDSIESTEPQAAVEG